MHLDSTEPKVNQDQVELAHLDQLDSRCITQTLICLVLKKKRTIRFPFIFVFYRENQVNRDFQELLDLKELQEHQVYQVCQEGQVLKVILVCQDFKVT